MIRANIHWRFVEQIFYESLDAFEAQREFYMPKADIPHTYDVLSGVSKNITFQNEHTELVDALGFADSLEKNSLTICDRL